MAKAVATVDSGIDNNLLQTAGRMFVEFEQSFVDHSARLMSACNKPVVGVSFLTDEQDQIIRRTNQPLHMPVFYPSPERAVNALAKMIQYRTFLNAVNG